MKNILESELDITTQPELTTSNESGQTTKPSDNQKVLSKFKHSNRIGKLHHDLAKVITTRLHYLDTDLKEKQYDPFLNKVMSYHGQFALPMPLADLLEIKNSINQAIIQLFTETQPNPITSHSDWNLLKKFIIHFFQTYRIIFFHRYNCEGFYDIDTQNSKNNRDFDFKLLIAADIEVKSKNEKEITELEETIWEISHHNHISLQQSESLISGQVEIDNLNALLFTQIELLNQLLVVNAAPGYALVLLLLRENRDLNPQSHQIKLSLAKIHENGFESFNDLHQLKPEAKAIAQTHFDNLLDETKNIFLLPNETFPTKSCDIDREFFDHLLEDIQKNNRTFGLPTIMPLISMLDLADNHKQPISNGNALWGKGKGKLRKYSLTPEVKRTYSPFAIKQRLKDPNASTFCFQSFTEWCLHRQGIAITDIIEFRASQKKIPECLISPKEIATRMVSDNFMQRLNQLEANFQKRKTNFNLHDLQRQGITHLYSNYGGLLANLATCEAMAQVVSLTLLLKQSNKIPLVVVADQLDVLRWQAVFREAGIAGSRIKSTFSYPCSELNYEEILNCNVIIITYRLLANRLTQYYKNEIDGLKILCGVMPAFPPELFDGYQSILPALPKTVSRLFQHAKQNNLFGSDNIIYERQDPQGHMRNYLRRLPVSEQEWDSVSKSTNTYGESALLKKTLTWIFIRQELQNKKLLNSYYAWIDYKASLDDFLNALYQQYPLLIDRQTVIDTLNGYRNKFALSMLVADKLPTSDSEIKTYQMLRTIASATTSQDERGSVIVVRSNPIKSPFELFAIFHLIHPELIYKPNLLRRAWKTLRWNVTHAMKFFVDHPHGNNQKEFTKRFKELYEEYHRLIDHQNKYSFPQIHHVETFGDEETKNILQNFYLQSKKLTLFNLIFDEVYQQLDKRSQNTLEKTKPQLLQFIGEDLQESTSKILVSIGGSSARITSSQASVSLLEEPSKLLRTLKYHEKRTLTQSQATDTGTQEQEPPSKTRKITDEAISSKMSIASLIT